MNVLSCLKVLKLGLRLLHFLSFYVDGANSCNLFTLLAYVRHPAGPTIPLHYRTFKHKTSASGRPVKKF